MQISIATTARLGEWILYISTSSRSMIALYTEEHCGLEHCSVAWSTANLMFSTALRDNSLTRNFIDTASCNVSYHRHHCINFWLNLPFLLYSGVFSSQFRLLQTVSATVSWRCRCAWTTRRYLVPGMYHSLFEKFMETGEVVEEGEGVGWAYLCVQRTPEEWRPEVRWTCGVGRWEEDHDPFPHLPGCCPPTAGLWIPQSETGQPLCKVHIY